MPAYPPGLVPRHHKPLKSFQILTYLDNDSDYKDNDDIDDIDDNDDIDKDDNDDDDDE